MVKLAAAVFNYSCINIWFSFISCCKCCCCCLCHVKPHCHQQILSAVITLWCAPVV